MVMIARAGGEAVRRIDRAVIVQGLRLGLFGDYGDGSVVIEFG